MKSNWILAGAVAAMMAASASSVLAQDTTMAPPPAPAAPGDMGMTNPGSLSTGSMSTMTPTGGIDFSVLNNPAYDYVDLMKAKANGLSDDEIASLAKITRLTGYSFTSLTEKVLRGTTFAKIAADSNLKLADVLDATDEKDKIAAYETAYQASGSMALKNMSGDMSGSMMPSSMSSMPAMAPTMDIVALAMKDSRFKTLVRELKKADLVSALQGPGPFTVFAPTDAAFKKLPKGALKNLEKDPTTLAMVLKYHVIPASVDAATAMAMTSPTSPPTLEGSTLQVTSGGGTVKVNDATVVQADIKASNGIIHAIDTVLMPTDLPASTSSTPSTDTSTTTPAPSTSGTGSTSTAPSPPGADTTAPATPTTPDTGTGTATPAAPAAQ